MLYVYTIFDQARDSKWPLMAALYEPTIKSLKIFTLYLYKTGRNIYDIEQDIKYIANKITTHSGEICVNDWKQHLIAYSLGTSTTGAIHDYPIQPVPAPTTVEEGKCLITKGLSVMRQIGMQPWTRIRADAAPVYRYLQDKGVLFGYELAYPIWHMDTYSGRTRTVGLTLQGLEDGAPVSNVNGDQLFVNFDWVSADFRAAALMSGDPRLEESFHGGDPYIHLADHINCGVSHDQLSRGESKQALLSSLYSLDTDTPALKYYADLGSWMSRCKSEVEAGHPLRSILGREFCVDGKERTIKSAFNAVIQGTVAHAMQASIRTVWEQFPDNILLENHDSLVLTSTTDQSALMQMITDVAAVMVRPFSGILEDNPVFPVVVSIGRVYKKWRRLKRFDA